MTARHHTTILCDGPGCTKTYPTNTPHTSEAHYQAKENGWVRRVSRHHMMVIDLCPVCSKKSRDVTDPEKRP